jgi:DNA-binding NtrC family response regulator
VLLLRFLQEREYHRLGETTPRRANVRIITAANTPLAGLVSQGRFRADLRYRLTPVTLAVPPLRARGQDVLLLARHFLGAAAAREGRVPPALGPELERILLAYSWPGNVRQLEQEMARLIVFETGGVLDARSLSSDVARDGSPRAARPLRLALFEAERAAVAQALEDHGGVRSATASALGISRQALHAKLRRLGLGRDDRGAPPQVALPRALPERRAADRGE